jgi:uncharacterized coiled-coil DUF342 family protein
MTDDKKFDIDAAKKLTEEISANLAGLPQNSARHAKLREEVEALKAMLTNAGSKPPEIEGKIRSVHSALDGAAVELQADGIRAGVFLSEIGRILGLD